MKPTDKTISANSGFFKIYPCRYCGQDIRFAKTTGGVVIPVTAETILCRHESSREKEYTLAEIERGLVVKQWSFKNGLQVGMRGYRVHREICTARNRQAEPQPPKNKNQMELF